MKQSIYNYLVSKEDCPRLLYNVLTGGLIEVDSQDISYLQSPSSWNESDPEFEILKESGFIVSDDLDELTYVEFENRKNCTQSTILSLTIAPTMACMCACPYCFEVQGDSTMPPQLQDSIIDTICEMVAQNGYKQVQVSWYGGEPLIAMDVIERMSQRLISKTHELDFTYEAYIITNGVLLTEEIVNRLNACAIKAAQITIDGLESTHDSLRPLKSGGGTFKTIMDNVLSAAEIASFDMNIRTNVGTDNADEYLELKNIIDAIGSPKVHTYAARRENYLHSAKGTEETCMSLSEFSCFLQENDLFRFRRQRKPECYSCLAESIHSFAIDSCGYVYKCWNEVGDTHCAFGRIDEGSSSIRVIDEVNALKYLVNHCIQDEECRKCKVLPLCMGGCLYQKANTGEKECIEEKYCLDDYVKQAYLAKRKEQGA